MTKMHYIVSITDRSGRTGALYQCPGCNRVAFSPMADMWCDKCSDEEIPTNSRMTL